MTVMGEASPEVWTAEWQRSGRVVFPVRRRPLLIRFGALVLLLAPNMIMSIDSLSEGGTDRVFWFIGLAGVACLFVLIGWQVATQRPALTIDREGIRMGRRRFMPWTDVGSIGIPHRPGFAGSLPIIPADVWAKDLILRQDTVRDLSALAAWLEVLLAEHRTTGVS
ncbi:hypothetical protein [Kribbella sp. CA-247076]|uniref:hypothetical protein n=1 Tax=Kribbella sp. CA-247076 TaxID=3239941 RepID=UPI003D8B619A